MAGRKKTETVEAEVVETAVVPAGKMEFRLINPTEDGFLRRIQWNKEELEAAVRAKIAGYENVVYTEENIKAAKNDRAELNKLIKAIEERRKQVKNIINEPYAVFEAELKEITALINEPVALIDQQVKAFEEIKHLQTPAFYGPLGTGLGSFVDSPDDSYGLVHSKLADV